MSLSGDKSKGPLPSEYEAIEFPPEFRPRFLAEVVLVSHQGGWIVDGTAHAQFLGGETINKIFPKLLQSMDGSRSLTDLTDQNPDIAAEHIKAVVTMLFGNGMVEDGNLDAMSTLNIETLNFFRRFLGVTGRNISGTSTYTKLHDFEILLVARSAGRQATEKLRSLLLNTGLIKVTILSGASPHEFATPGLLASKVLVVSLSPDGEDFRWHLELDRWCFDNGFSWLRAVISRDLTWADVGPFFKFNEGPCYSCFIASQSTADCDIGTAQAPLERNLQTQCWMGMVAIEVIYIVTQIGPLISRRGTRRYNLDSWAYKEIIHFRAPGCPRCLRLDEKASDLQMDHAGVNVAFVFEDSVGLASSSVHDPTTVRENRRTGSLLARQGKSLPVCRSYCLSNDSLTLSSTLEDALRGDSFDNSELFSLDQLAMILKMAAGLRGPQEDAARIRRWSATAGNLGSVELYIAARNVDGLPPGLYFYQPQLHSLAAIELHSGKLDIVELIRGAQSHTIADPDALIFFTGAFHRVSRKYGPFGYRLLNLDAGVALSQAQIVAATLKVHSCVIDQWSDRFICDYLRLDTPHEQLTAVMALSRIHICGKPRPIVQATEVGLSTPHRISDFSGSTLHSVLDLLYKESRSPAPEAPRAMLTPNDLKASTAEAIALLVPPPPCHITVGSILLKRRTVHRYLDRSVSMELLLPMLTAALESDARDWPQESTDGCHLVLRILARSVEGLNPGVFQYNAEERRLFISSHLPTQIPDLFGQPEFATAPVQIWICADLARACSYHGAWGHRCLLVRAGAAAHRAWLAGIGQGLGCAIVAGWVPGSARSQLGLDGYRHAGLVVLAAGEPSDQD